MLGLVCIVASIAWQLRAPNKRGQPSAAISIIMEE